MEIVSRFLVALTFIAFGVLLFVAWNRWQLRRLSGARRAPGLEGWQSGLPGILYFTTPDCAPCYTMQQPALERLRAEWVSGLQVVEIDASAQTGIADHWGVLSVPTTFVLDANGQPQHINHGVASAEKLRRQLQGLGIQGHKAQGLPHPAP